MRSVSPAAWMARPGRHSWHGSPPRKSQLTILGQTPQVTQGLACFCFGVVGSCDHALARTPWHTVTEAGPLPSTDFHRLPRYYEPLGLPPSSLTFRTRLIGRVFARRKPLGRVSPVPYRSVDACRLPYPGGVLRRISESPDAVCCLRPVMTGSAPSPFGFYLTRLQRFTKARPAALPPAHEPYGSRQAFDVPLRREDLSPRPEPATRRLGRLTAAGLAPARLVQLLRTHHGGILGVPLTPPRL